MSLIEHLEDENWHKALRRSFEGAIDLLQHDRFRMTSSSVDDMRSWLASGGVSRARLQLDRQMEARRLGDQRQNEIREFLGQLAQEHRQSLMKLIADDIIPWNQADFLATSGMSEPEFEVLWQQISAGENPFEVWMLSNGYPQETIDQLYQIIDRWLVKAGLRFPEPPIDPNLN
jgi:hypothetical protein